MGAYFEVSKHVESGLALDQENDRNSKRKILKERGKRH